MMKTPIILFFVLSFANFSHSQILQGHISNSETKEKLDYANITFLRSNSGTNTNSSGFYTIDIKNHQKDSLKISYVGFESKLISLGDFIDKKTYNLNIDLNKKVTNLEEVTIESKKKLYTEKRSLGEKRDGNIAMFSLIGFETACFIENPFQKEGIVKSIKLDVKKNPNADFVAKFNIKLYEYDKENNKPGTELLSENLIVSPKNKNYKLKIDMLDYKIPFKKDGICIGIELLDAENLSKKWDKIGPGFRFTNNESKQITWYNYRSKGFYQGNLGHKAKTGNLIVGLEVLLENEK